MHGEQTALSPRLALAQRTGVPSAALAPSLAVALTVVAGLLRLDHLGALSLWVDEGLTVAYSHLSWAAVLGLHGAYAPHPPLYFALVKVAHLFLPDVSAGRTVSLVAGTMTVPALYALGSRLAGRTVGLSAAAVLTLSPLHIWYSQEARPYALNALLICLAYLALVTYLGGGESRWLVTYGFSLALSMYVEYSAIYALLPQVPLLAWLLWKRRERVGALIAAGAVAAACFLPWLPQLLTYAHGTSEQTQFALSGPKVWDVALAVVGLSGEAGYFWSGLPSVWRLWPGADPFLLLTVLLAAVLGGAALLRRGWMPVIVPLCLSLGTVGVAVTMAVVYPGFTYRTVLYAVLGWALLAGAAPLAAGRRGRLLGALALLLTLAFSTVTTHAFGEAYKQQFRLMADDLAAVGSLRLPILTYPAVTSTLIEVYHPHALPAHHPVVDVDGELPPGMGRPPAFWFAYTLDPYATQALHQIVSLGYRPLIQNEYTGPISLDLWALPRAPLGRPIDVDGTFAERGGQALQWTLPPHAAFRPAPGGQELILRHRGAGEAIATGGAAARPDRLYTLGVDVRATASASPRLFLICATAAGAFLDIAPNGGGATAPSDGRWHEVETAAFCPLGTTWARVDLRADGRGQVAYRGVELRELGEQPAAP